MNFIQSVKCFFNYHVYQPVYMVVQVQNSKRKPLYREFQFECRACATKTKWMRMRRLSEFMSKNNVSW